MDPDLVKNFSQPSRGDVHINQPLTNISVAWMQDTDMFVAEKVFPTIPVMKQSDAYFTYDRGEFNRDTMEERMPGTESAGGTYKIGNETYYARVYAYHKDVPDQIRDNADSPLQLDMEATQFVSLKGMLKREITWSTRYFTTGVWGFEATGTDDASAATDNGLRKGNSQSSGIQRWNQASSTPIEDIRRMKRLMLEETGFRPNVLTLGRAVFDTLVDHPDIIGRMDRGQTTGPAMANMDSLAALFEVEHVYCMDAIRNTEKEGATPAHSFIGGKHALLSYAPTMPGLMTPSAGYTFVWTGFRGASAMGNRIKRFRMENLESDRVENQITYDQKVISDDLGGFFNGIVA